MESPRIFGLYAEPRRGVNWLLPALPFIIIIVAYLLGSEVRHTENPQDKLLPFFWQMGEAMWRMATEEDARTGTLLLWTDTWASLVRLFIGVTFSALTALLLGINVALFPGMRSLLLPAITVLSIIPPLALLPILFITFGVGEEAKIVLIYIGTVFMITRDIYLATQSVPREQITKSLTLGASQLGVVYRVIMPQIIPRLINAVRLSLGAAWLFLIAAEAIASTEGLGYRIFLVRRYLAMGIIIPYVMWVTLLGFAIDFALRKVVDIRYPWYGQDR